jgi:hypothetical protein
MIKYILVFVLLSFGVSGVAQSEVLIRMQLEEEIEADVASRLRQALQQSGILLDGVSTTTLSGQLSPGREGQIEGNAIRYIVSYDLLLEARLAGNGQLFHTALVTLEGTGKNKLHARQEALRQLSVRNRSWQQAMDQLRTDYVQTLHDNCAPLLAQADQLEERHQLLTALALADGIPMDSPCYTQARERRLSYYQTYQQRYCEDHLELAGRQLALGLPNAALDEIAKIDTSSPCAAAARKLLDEAAGTLKEQQAAKAQFLRQVYQNQVEVETARSKVISGLIEGQ